MSAARPHDGAVVAALVRRLGATDAATLANLAWFAGRRGAHGAALDAARRAVAHPHAPPAAWRTLERLAAGRSDGLLLALTGDPQPAAAPGAGHPLAAAVMAHRQDALAVAEARYRAALADPRAATAAWNGLAVLHEQRGERHAADEAWERCLAAGDLSGVHNRALAWLRRGESSRARALLAAWIGRATAPASLLYLAGLAALNDDDAGIAAPFLQAAITADPDLARAHFTLGLAWERLGEHGRALGATRHALLLSPWYVPQVWLLDAEPGAVPTELPAEGGDSGALGSTDEVLLTLGRSLLEMSHLGEAMAVFDQVLVRQPSQTAALFHRGVVLAKLRRYGEALEDWEAVGRVDPDGPLGAMSRRHARSARQLASLFAAG
jgi:tetratricopeptide (TPR) repeat protein